MHILFVSIAAYCMDLFFILFDMERERKFGKECDRNTKKKKSFYEIFDNFYNISGIFYYFFTLIFKHFVKFF